jgi:hypothetical protein
MLYNLYTIEYVGVRNHVAIFVEAGPAGNGLKYHVIGNILTGMEFQVKPVNR